MIYQPEPVMLVTGSFSPCMAITAKDLAERPVLRNVITGLKYEIVEEHIGNNPRTALFKLRKLLPGADPHWHSITEINAGFEVDEPENQDNDFYNQSDEQRDRKRAG
jgi:hypothetical protein